MSENITTQNEHTLIQPVAQEPAAEMITRVPTQAELASKHHVEAALKTEPTDTSSSIEAITNTAEGALEPVRHSPTSVGQPGPNSPWGPTQLTGNYKRVSGGGDLMVQVTTIDDGSDPMLENSKVTWVPLSQIQSGTVKWTSSHFPGGAEISLAA